MGKEYKLDVSIFADSIKEQLESQGVGMHEKNKYGHNDYEKYEEIRTGIIMLRVHNYLAPSATKKMWEKFYKDIQNDIYDIEDLDN